MSDPDPVRLEACLQALEPSLAEAERRAAALAAAVKRLRKAAREGTVGALPAALAQAGQEAARAGDTLAAAAAAWRYDLAAAFEGGAFLDELAAAASAAGVTLVQRDGRVTAFPVALRLDVRGQGVRVGRRLEKRIRPGVLAAGLKQLQLRPERFNARAFLDRLFRLYEPKARAEDPSWRPRQPGPGPLVPLADLHDQLTLLPVAASDYPLEEFTADLLRLDRVPDATTSAGHRFELGGSTGRKGAKRLTLFDEAGEQHDYYAIRYILDPADGRSDHQDAAAR
jgi:hypothetical protein